ncbi:60S acidic ribosomal protein P2 [Grifola frondosa]|uniref:60S acidic ribosomal protein P2 n=1 Tax=Grifola frondosa TaxID=5627 RepID=A0A1C7MBI5_GRIFR|nr:60S acidic ribosomal protein P2 [Grifola frondosa]
MRHIAAYLLLQIGGKASPSAADVKSVLGAVGIEADDERLEKLIAELSGKDINQLIAEGSSKLSSVPSGGAAVVSAGAAGGGAPAAAAEEKKEEKKEEEKEESDDDMGFGLFD